MKKLSIVYTFFLLVFITVSSRSHAQAKFDCPIGGDNTNAKVQAADSLKNRSAIPESYNTMTVEELLSMKVTDKANQRKAIAVKGYIMDVKDGGKESCNCHSTTFKDTHIYLVKDANSADESKAVIVEVTPRMRKKLGPTKDLKSTYLNQEVTVYGYLFCDAEHKENSTADKGKGNHWRGTVWEVHPITKIELASK